MFFVEGRITLAFLVRNADSLTSILLVQEPPRLALELMDWSITRNSSLFPGSQFSAFSIPHRRTPHNFFFFLKRFLFYRIS